MIKQINILHRKMLNVSTYKESDHWELHPILRLNMNTNYDEFRLQFTILLDNDNLNVLKIIIRRGAPLDVLYNIAVTHGVSDDFLYTIVSTPGFSTETFDIRLLAKLMLRSMGKTAKFALINGRYNITHRWYYVLLKSAIIGEDIETIDMMFNYGSKNRLELRDNERRTLVRYINRTKNMEIVGLWFTYFRNNNR